MNFLKKKTVEEKKVIATSKTIESLLKENRTKKIGLDAASYIQGKLKNWFTIDQLLDKTTYNQLEVALDIMNLLCLLELCYREEKLKGVIKYKITINSAARLMLLYEEREEAQGKLDYIDNLINKITKSIDN